MAISKIKEHKFPNPQPKNPNPQTTNTIYEMDIFEVSVYRRLFVICFIIHNTAYP